MNETLRSEELIKIHNEAVGERPGSGSEKEIIEKYETDKRKEEKDKRNEVRKANAEYWLEVYSNPQNDSYKNLGKVAEGKKEASESLRDIIDGWDYLDSETKQLAAAAFPELAKLVLYKKTKERKKNQ